MVACFRRAGSRTIPDRALELGPVVVVVSSARRRSCVDASDIDEGE